MPQIRAEPQSTAGLGPNRGLPLLQSPNLAFQSGPFAADACVRVRTGSYETLIPHTTLLSLPSALPRLAAEAAANNARDGRGYVTLQVEADGKTFRHVENYLRDHKLPRGLSDVDLSYLQSFAEEFSMPDLVREAGDVYPLRRAVRCAHARCEDDPCAFIVSLVILAAELIVLDNYAEALHHLETAYARYPASDGVAVAEVACDEAEVRRSSYLFGFLAMRNLTPNGKVLFLKSLRETPPTSHFIASDMAEYLYVAQGPEVMQFFLQKSDQIFAADSPYTWGQHIRVDLLTNGLPAEAEHAATRALSRAPQHPFLQCLLGIALTRQGRHAEAQPVLRHALETAPVHEAPVSAWMSLAQSQAATGDHQAASASYHQAQFLAPYAAPAYTGLAQSLMAQNRLEEAETWQRHLLNLEPTVADHHIGLGQILSSRNQHHAALACYVAAQYWDPTHGLGISGQVFEADQLHDYPQAIAAQRRLLSLMPSAAGYMLLGNLLLFDNKPLEANLAMGHAAHLASLTVQDSTADSILAHSLPALAPGPSDVTGTMNKETTPPAQAFASPVSASQLRALAPYAFDAPSPSQPLSGPEHCPQ